MSETERGEPLSIGLSLLSGNCNIYLSRNNQLLNSCDHGIGCPLGLFQEERSCSINAPFVIHPEDAWYIEEGVYYIAITSTDVEEERTSTYYNIAVYTVYTILFLNNALPTWDYIEEGEYRYYDLFCSNDQIEALDVVITPNDLNNMPFSLNAVISTTRPRPTDPALPEEFVTEWIDEHGAVFSMQSDDIRFVESKQYYIAVHAVANPEYLEYGGDDGSDDGHSDHDGVDSMVYTISATATASDVLEYRLGAAMMLFP